MIMKFIKIILIFFINQINKYLSLKKVLSFFSLEHKKKVISTVSKNLISVSHERTPFTTSKDLSDVRNREDSILGCLQRSLSGCNGFDGIK